jgi:hypothetical protein
VKRILLALSLLAAASVFAQSPQATGINGSLLNMFGDIKEFTAQGEVRITDTQGKEVSVLPVSMAMRDGKLRTEMDISKMRGGNMPAEAAEMMKSTGMDRMQMLNMPESKTSMVIYPGLKAYASIPDEEATGPGAKVVSTDIGKETIDGHPCVKRKLTVTDEKGKTQEAFVWAATDLKNFPIKMELKQKRNTIQIQYKSPVLEKPDAKLFEPPAGYTKHDSIQGLMQSAMMKMFGDKL